MPCDPNSSMKQTSSTICMNQNNCFSWIADVSKLPLSNLEKMKWAISHGGYQMAVAVHTALALNVRMGEFCSMPHKLGWPYWAVHVWSSYGLDDFQIKLRITDGPLGANKLSAPLSTRHKSCTGVPRFCSEVSFYKDFQIKQFTRPADYRGLTSPSIPVEQEGMP